MAGDPLLSVDASGLGALAADLKAAEKDLAKEQRRQHREVATKVAGWARFAAAGGTRQQSAASGAIRPRATAMTARLAVVPTAAAPFARAAFWGSDKRTGWYAGARYAGSAGRQSQPWVGNTWIAGRRGEGPYAINDALADHVEQIEAMYGEAVRRALRTAFPGEG